MKITDMKVAIIGQNPVVRIVTDEGIDGLGAAETAKHYLKWHIEFYKGAIIGMDPTNVERVMLNIRRMGAFKPWGSAVSAIEVALWDIAGKAAGLPIHKLLGGKIRDRVRIYNGSKRKEVTKYSPESFAENMQWMKDQPENFSIIKQGVTFHSRMPQDIPNYYYGEYQEREKSGEYEFDGRYPNRGKLTESGLNFTIECVAAMKAVLGDEEAQSPT